MVCCFCCIFTESWFCNACVQVPVPRRGIPPSRLPQVSPQGNLRPVANQCCPLTYFLPPLGTVGCSLQCFVPCLWSLVCVWRSSVLVTGQADGHLPNRQNTKTPLSKRVFRPIRYALVLQPGKKGMVPYAKTGAPQQPAGSMQVACSPSGGKALEGIRRLERGTKKQGFRLAPWTHQKGMVPPYLWKEENSPFFWYGSLEIASAV